MKNIFILISLMFTCILISEEIPDYSIEKTGYVYFFENKVPDTLKVKNGTLKIDKTRYKDGLASLSWKYNKNSELEFNNPAIISSNTIPFTFMAWFYQEKPIDDKLTFNFYNNNKLIKTFSMKLNFKGWHGIAVPYSDMQGNNEEKINRLVIISPNTKSKILIDEMVFSIPMDTRYPAADFFTDFINYKARTSVNKHWNAILMYQEIFNTYLKNKEDIKLSTEYNEYIEDIIKKIESINEIDREKVYSEEKIYEVIKKWDSFNIREVNKVLQGKKLAFPNSLVQYKNLSFLSKDTTKILTESIDIRTLGINLQEISKILNSKDLNEKYRKILEDNFILTVRFIIDQGYNFGSGFQTVDHMGYQTRELFKALFNNRDLLKKYRLLFPVQQMMFWYSMTGRLVKNFTYDDINVDVLNTQLQYMLQSILLMDDKNLQNDLLNKLKIYLDNNLKPSIGLLGGFKIDNSMFHHFQNYVAYGNDSLGGLTPVIYALSDTPYKISDKNYERLKNVVMSMDFYTKNINIPISLAGRHPNEKVRIRPYIYKYMAYSNPMGLDEELMKVYNRVSNKQASGDEQEGNLVMNYAAMLVNRFKDTNSNKSTLVIFRGYSRYLVGNETYVGANLFGRYNLYGRMETIPTEYENRAYRYQGYDWNHFEGVTSEYLPLNDLKADLEGGYEEMLLSDETYVGANKLDNYSMFSMKVHGHDKYNQENNRANKSYFVFDGNILALGTNIQSKSENETHTTIFQHFMKEKDKLVVNGKEVSEKVQLKKSENILKTPSNISYYVNSKDLVLTYKEQESLDPTNYNKVTKGLFATLYINHGKNVKDGKYIYQMTVGDSKKEKYVILKNDNKVHSIKYKDIIFYSFFKKDKINNKDSLILSSDTESMYIVKNMKNKLKISALNPDLNLYEGVDQDQYKDGKLIEANIYEKQWARNKSKKVLSEFTIKGIWKTQDEGIKIEYVKNNTKVLLYTVDGIAKEFELIK